MSVVSDFCALVKAPDISTNNVYEDELRKLGIDSVTIPALSFQYINQDELLMCLRHASVYCGLILTSQRVIESIVHVLNPCEEAEKESILCQWREKRSFTVGEATANAAASLLHLDCTGETSGSAEALVHAILEQIHPASKPLLYPCSNLAKDSILSVKNHGIEVQRIEVYETSVHPLLKESIQAVITTKGIPEIWVCFSPSGVQHLLAKLSSLNISSSILKFVAIGPSTNRALQQKNVIPWCIAEKPTPKALAEAIQVASSSR